MTEKLPQRRYNIYVGRKLIASVLASSKTEAEKKARKALLNAYKDKDFTSIEEGK